MLRILLMLSIFYSSLTVAAGTSLSEMVDSPLSTYIDELKKTPLDTVLDFHTVPYSKEVQEYRNQLNRYRGAYDDSIGLTNYCSVPRKITFAKYQERLLFLRDVVSTLQSIGLKKTIPAIGEYLRLLRYDEQGAENIIENLIGNYCSNNLSLMSIRKIKEIFFAEYRNDSGKSRISTIKKNPFFPKKLDLINSNEGIYENELFYTIELFKSFCSWGGDPTDLRLMTPLLKSPLLFSYLIRQLNSQKLYWMEESKEIVKVRDDDTTHVLCKGFICRDVPRDQFIREFPKSVGSDSLEYDLKNIYCDYFSTVNYKFPQIDERLERLIKDRTDYDEAFLVAQFTSLITGIPDLLLRANKFNEVFKYLNISIDRHFTLWAQKEMKKMSDYLFYEDSLKVKKVERSHYYNEYIPKFSVHFDASLGEWDRSVYENGKVRFSFDLNIPKKLLGWVKKEYNFIKSGDTQKVLEVEKRVIKQVQIKRKEVEKKLKFPLWNARIDKIIARELIDQIVYYKGTYFNSLKEEKTYVPVVFDVGPFALKYLNYQSKVDKEQKALNLPVEK